MVKITLEVLEPPPGNNKEDSTESYEYRYIPAKRVGKTEKVKKRVNRIKRFKVRVKST